MASVLINSKNTFHPIAKRYFDKIISVGGDVLDKRSVNDFVTGLSQLIDPAKWICWPLRSIHNIGTGSTAYSVGGITGFDGTLTNGPTWSSTGMFFSFPATSQYVNYGNGLQNLTLNVDFSMFGGIDAGLQDNFSIFNFVNVAVSDAYGSLSCNQSNAIGVNVQVTRNSVGVNSSIRGGAFPSAFSTVGGVIRSTSQATYRNGSLIVNDTGLNARNPTGAFNGTRTGVGNGGTSAQTVPFVIFILGEVNPSFMHILLKSTLGSGLNIT